MNKAALVTGAAQGLGFCLCRKLLERGYFVVALDYKISDELKLLEGERCQIIQCDISQDEDVLRAKEQSKASHLDIVFNNAGIWLEKSRMSLLDEGFEFDSAIKQYQVNAIGVLRIAKAFIPQLNIGNTKIMINISSEAGSISSAQRICEYGYCMSKAAQNMATKILSNAFSDKGIKFYSIHPGWMITPQGVAGATNGSYPEQKPEDSAKILIDLAEGTRRDGIYYDIEGNELTW